MEKKNLKKIFVSIMIIMLIILICITKSLAATPRPSDIKGDVENEVEMEFMDKLIDMLTKIGAFGAVGALMAIGIRYMSGSLEEKAAYKKTMMPYIIGCILVFGASTISPMIIDIFKEAEEVEDVGNVALGLIQVIGTFISIGILMILGIKYMIGSTEEKASYKRAMLPYLVGSILLFGAVNLTTVIVNIITINQPVEYIRRNGKLYCGRCEEELNALEQRRGECSCGAKIKDI